MVLLCTTPQILQTISLLPPSSLTSLSLPSTTSDPISHQTLTTIARLARKHNVNATPQPHPVPKNATITLNALLKSTRPYTPPPPAPPAKTPEYLALMAHLKAEQERKIYAALTTTASPHTQSLFATDDSTPEQDEDNISPSLVLNILLSVVLCAVAVFQLTRYWPNDGVRVLLSLGVALVVGVAEAVVYAAYLRNVGDARRRERARREKKVLLGEYTGGDGLDAWSEGKTGDEQEQKTEIWGRGVNGGVRRRVREKWEREQQDKSL